MIEEPSISVILLHMRLIEILIGWVNQTLSTESYLINLERRLLHSVELLTTLYVPIQRAVLILMESLTRLAAHGLLESKTECLLSIVLTLEEVGAHIWSFNERVICSVRKSTATVLSL